MAKIVVFPCCARKKDYYWEDNGRKVKFVANPGKCDGSDEFRYYRPDDKNPDTGKTWRQEVSAYNEEVQRTGEKWRKLRKAWELYEPNIYEKLKDTYGEENFFILSAGWGLVRSDYLLPYYNITFSSSGKSWERRRNSDEYRDFNQLAEKKIEQSDTIYFFGLQDYLDLYYELTEKLPGDRKVIYHYQCKKMDQRAGYKYIPYKEAQQTRGWQYDCVRDFLKGKLDD